MDSGTEKDERDKVAGTEMQHTDGTGNLKLVKMKLDTIVQKICFTVGD